MKLKLGIFLYNDVEVLDFAGPFEVFSVTNELNNYQLFDIYTFSTSTSIMALNGLSVSADKPLKDVENLDVLVIPGGAGSRVESEKENVLLKLEELIESASYVLSICSGARFLAHLGLLKNAPFCTHQGVYQHISHLEPSAIPQSSKRFITHGKITTTGGISAGIDGSFHLLKTIHGENIVKETAEYMEYFVRDENGAPLKH
ncbi:MAG: DJ-1/PfpI family protein [Oceanospirillaceae bacterium]|nr:DJ-1/PfpI family protein [Oceanospirillaceae bacterium]